MNLLKQNTAVTLKMGPFLDDADGKTVEPSLTITQADVRLSKNGGNLAQKSDTASATYDEIGIYDVTLNATDTNTLGRLDIFIHKAGALPVFASFMVAPANVWNSFFSTDYLQVDTMQIEGQDATNQIDARLVAYDAATGAEVASLASDIAAITGTGGVAIGTGTMQAIAAELLKYDIGNVEDTAAADSLAALILATFFGSISGTTFNIYKTDGLTLFATTNVTTNASAEPIVAVGI